LHIGGSDGGDQAEEDEDEHLTQPEIAVRMLAAGVIPGGQDAGSSDSDQPPLAGQGDQYQPEDCSQTETAERRRSHLPRTGRSGPHQPLRADPLRVGAPHPIRIIVGVVDSDLQPEGDQRGQDRAGRAEPLLVNRDTGTRQHWCDGCGQRPQTRALDPLGDTRHVQFPLGSAGRFQR